MCLKCTTKICRVCREQLVAWIWNDINISTEDNILTSVAHGLVLGFGGFGTCFVFFATGWPMLSWVSDWGAGRVRHWRESLEKLGGKVYHAFPLPFNLLNLVRLHSPSEVEVPHDWLQSSLSGSRRAPDKGAEEPSMMAPTHLPGEHLLFSSTLWRQNFYLPCTAATGCTLANEQSINQSAQTSEVWARACLAFIAPTLQSLHRKSSWCSAKHLHL